MSRCFAFSPEALSNGRSSHVALIELHKEKKGIITLMERVENMKKHLKKHGDKKTEKKHQNMSSTKKGNSQMAMSDDSGKSDVTEELTPPTYSSSRIGNPVTNKRKRDEDSSPDGVDSKRTIIRFRLPLESAEKPIAKPLEKEAEEAMQRSKVVDAKKKTSKRSSPYKTLIEDWVPSSIEHEMACEDDEEDWLFGSRKKQEEHEKQDREYCLRTGMWPQATHFPELDLYALPYTVLF